MADKKFINSAETGIGITRGNVFGDNSLTPGGTFSNKPRYFEYNPTQDSEAKIVLTLERVKEAIKDQLKKEEGEGFENSEILVESFLYEFTNLLIDYRDLRNHVFFGSAYTELAYNIRYLIQNFPYKFLIATETDTLETVDSLFSFDNDAAAEETTFIIKQDAIKDGIEEFNFFDNNIEFNWLNYDLIDINGRRYPVKKVITPYNATTGIFEISNISNYTMVPTGYPSFDTLQITTIGAHNYQVGQGINIYETKLVNGNLEKTLDENYIVIKIIDATHFAIVNKYAGLKILRGEFDLVTEAVEIPAGYTFDNFGRVRMIPLSLNNRPYEIKIIIQGNLTNSQLLNYQDDLDVEYSGFMLAQKQVKISEFDYTLTPIQKMLLAPESINPTPWPRRSITDNIQHLSSPSDYNPREDSFIDWLQSPSNSTLRGTQDDTDLAFSDPFFEYRLVSALALDETQTNQLLRRCIPHDVISELNDTENGYFQRFILIAGWMFDQIRVYVKFIKYTHHLNYTEYNQLSPEYYKLFANYYGFELFNDDSIDFSKLVVQTEPGYYFTDPSLTIDTNNRFYRFTLKQLQYERQKRLLLSLLYLYKIKGTQGAIKKLVSLLGAPEGFLEFNEYSFNIQNTDQYDYYDVATLKGVRTVDNEKVYAPEINFEIDPDYPQPLGMPPVYRMRLSNESKVNLRMASILTNPNGAIDHQIINIFGKQKYDYGKLNEGEYANLQDLNDDLTVNKPFYVLPLSFPDKYSGITVEYMIPKGGFKKGIANNLEETSIHLCSLYQLPTPRTGTEVKPAVASITITDIGTVGEQIEVFINDNEDGVVSMGTYTVTSGDTNKIILAENIAAALSLTTTNGVYNITTNGNIIIITAPPLSGENLNGDRVSVVIS